MTKREIERKTNRHSHRMTKREKYICIYGRRDKKFIRRERKIETGRERERSDIGCSPETSLLGLEICQ